MNSFGLGTRNRVNEREITDIARARGEFADQPSRPHHVAQHGGFDYAMLRLARWLRRRVTRGASTD